MLCAPHVGIDHHGLVGAIQRHEQDQHTPACGAAVGALGAIKKDKTEGNFKNGYLDHQMDCIKHLLLPHMEQIVSSQNENVTLAYKMFDIQAQFLEGVINLNWQSPKSKLVIVGGIHINSDNRRDNADKFLPLKFEVRTLQGNTDLLGQTFGQPAYVSPR